jgi:hypothetical protein
MYGGHFRRFRMLCGVAFFSEFALASNLSPRAKYPSRNNVSKLYYLPCNYQAVVGNRRCDARSLVLPLCGKKVVNTQCRHVWGKKWYFRNPYVFYSVHAKCKKCTGAKERKNLEPPTNNGWILQKHCKVLFCHIKRLCLK